MNLITDIRQKWLRGTLAFMTGWTFFWLCLIVMAAVTLLTVDLVLPGDGLPPWPGGILMLICLVVTVFATVKFVKYQDQFMGRKSVKASYVLLAVLALLAILSMPTPFLYTSF